MIKRWREINLGEGDEDAERGARRIAAAQQHHFEGESEENLPEDVKAYLNARWQEMRERLDQR